MKGGLSEFFAMGGYALYVWGSFGVTALLMVVEPIMVRQRRKAAISRISRLIRLKSEQKS
jgi:heme exporter protein D